MNIWRSRLILLSLFVAMALEPSLSFAAQKKLPDQDPVPVQKPSVNISKVQKAGKPSMADPKVGLLRKSTVPMEASPSKKNHRAIKAHKKSIPKAVVQPRTDLIHYGVLEDSQRYDPRPRADSAGLPSPQTPDLTHDHFQELDRNQDGMIDPVERAFGRIDMDRDLDTRTLQ